MKNFGGHDSTTLSVLLHGDRRQKTQPQIPLPVPVPTSAVAAIELEPNEPALAAGQRALPQALQRLGAVQEHLEGFEALGQLGALLQAPRWQRVRQEDVIEAPVGEKTRLGQRGDGDAAPRAARGQRAALPAGREKIKKN